MSKSAQATLRARWNTDWNVSHLTGPLSGHVGKIGAAISDLKLAGVQFRGAGRLTDVGIREAILEKAKTETVPALRRAQHELKRTRDGISAYREKLVAPTIDKSDLAAAMLRQEIRARLVAMKDADRIRLLSATKDVRILDAYQELPTFCRIPAEVENNLAEARLEASHGPEVHKIREAEKAAGIVEAMLTDAMRELRKDLDLPHNGAFDSFVREACAEVDRENGGSL